MKEQKIKKLTSLGINLIPNEYKQANFVFNNKKYYADMLYNDDLPIAICIDFNTKNWKYIDFEQEF